MDTFAELTFGNPERTIRIEGRQPPDGADADSYLMVKSEGLSGWWSTPTPKISRTELGQGDGASNVEEQDIRYSARVVTLECAAIGSTHEHVMEAYDRVLAVAHHLVRLRVYDGKEDTYVVGTVAVTSTEHWSRHMMGFTLEVTCSQPERLSTVPHEIQLICDSLNISGGGLSYGPGLATYWEGEPNNSPSVLVTDTLMGTSGLHYPLTYRTIEHIDNPNTGLLENRGTSRAYPVFKVFGPFEDGVELLFPGTGLTLSCAYPLRSTQVLTLDSRTRTASVGGRDVTETVIQRGFPTIGPGCGLQIVLTTTGTGFVNASVHDTYM